MSRILIALLVLSVPAVARAQDEIMTCTKKPLQVKNEIPQTQTEVEGRPGVIRTVFEGDVRIDCDDMHLQADRVEKLSDSDIWYATGNVLLVQPGLSIGAVKAEINGKTKLGKFFTASGYARLADKPSSPTGIAGEQPDIQFHGELLERTGPRTYRLTNGAFTSCQQPTPRWEMTGSRATITLDKRVVLKNATLKVKDVPLFYVPYLYYPIDHEGRNSGFLMPKYGSSTAGGFTLTNQFFWAISRSQDATFSHDWFKKSGQGLGAEYRYASAPGSDGNVHFNLINEREQFDTDGLTVLRPAQHSYDFSGYVNQGLPHRFRLQATSNYFSSATTQQLYQQNFFDVSQRRRTMAGTVSGGSGRYWVSVGGTQSDTYSDTDLALATRYRDLPRASVSMPDRPIGKSRVYVGVSGEGVHFLQQDDLANPETRRGTWRLDGSPRIRAPLSNLSFLSVTTTASWRFTEWSSTKDPETGALTTTALNRQLLTLQVSAVGPRVQRVFTPKKGRYAEKYKHLIEPNFSLAWNSPFREQDRIIRFDGTDDLVGGNGQITYGLTNSILAKRKLSPESTVSVAQTVLTVDIKQTHYSDAFAASYDQQYSAPGALPPPSNFSPVSIVARASPTPGSSATFSTNIDPKFRKPKDYNASGSVNSRTVQVSGGWRRVFFESDKKLVEFENFLMTSARLKSRDGHLGGSYGLQFDIKGRRKNNQSFVFYYNSQCCGLTVDYQTMDISHLNYGNAQSNRRFGVSFTLAGLGSFSNPLGSFGGR